jgi:hypothetical protein
MLLAQAQNPKTLQHKKSGTPFEACRIAVSVFLIAACSEFL